MCSSDLYCEECKSTTSFPTMQAWKDHQKVMHDDDDDEDDDNGDDDDDITPTRHARVRILHPQIGRASCRERV